MTVHCQRFGILALLTVVFWPSFALAQFDSFGFSAMQEAMHGGKQGICVSGTSTVQRKPTQLRLYVQLLAKDKSLADALAKLKDRQEAATAQLESLKADKKSITFGVASLSGVQSARKRQIEAMIMAKMRSRGKSVPKGLQAPQTVTVTSQLTAQWPIEVESHEKMLLMVQELKEKIKAADLAGAKEVAKLSPEEQEFEEEAAQTANQFGEEESQTPGEPQFVFVAALPKAERQKAMIEAVAKARQQANDLAQAAEIELGPLVGMAGTCTGQILAGDETAVQFGRYGGSDALRRMLTRQSGNKSEDKQDESMSIEPDGLRFDCCVSATFRLGK